MTETNFILSLIILTIASALSNQRPSADCPDGAVFVLCRVVWDVGSGVDLQFLSGNLYWIIFIVINVLVLVCGHRNSVDFVRTVKGLQLFN